MIKTDEEFIDAWKRFKSPEKVAKALNLTVRGVYKRRINLEVKYGIHLDSENPQKTVRPKISVPKEGFRALADVKGIVIVFSDGHFWPGERSVAFDALIKLIDLLKPKVIVAGGDSFDGARISRHAPNGWEDLPSVAEELEAVKERHSEIESVAPKNTPLIWTLGNHDTRFTARLATHSPEYAKVYGMDLADHFPSWEFCWSLWINNHTVCKHRFHSGIHGAHSNALKSGKNIVTGHTHRLQNIMYSDYNGIRFGIETGTLSDFGPKVDKFSYGEDNPSNWSQGFVVLTFDENDGKLLEPEMCRVFDGKAYFRGKAIK